MNPVSKIDPDIAEDIRDWAVSGLFVTEIGPCLVDSSERWVAATGRARCRRCGLKIPKGERAIPFQVSFQDAGYNCWNANRVYIHYESCEVGA